MSGPLEGIRIIEIAGIGPAPFAGMMLADAGAEVLRIDKVAGALSKTMEFDLLNRGRKSLGVDLKNPDGKEAVLKLVARADALIEGFRPKVAEKLGIGPKECLDRNPKLVYCRMTGWGQVGPLADKAGHDINYIAVSGTLDAIGRAGEPPLPPINLVGDFGGGGALLAFGVLAGLLETSHSGKGQVVDAAMVDGAALLATMIHSFRALGWWTDERGTNLLDTGAPFYEVYETKDNKWISVGAIEPQFYAQLIERLGLDQDDSLPPQMDRSHWPEMKKKFAAIFKTKTRDEWCKVMEDVDACFAPVLSMAEAPKYPHNRDREVFIESDGVVQPAAAPRFSRTPSSAGPLERSSGESLPKKSKEAVFDMLSSWGFDLEEVTRLVNNNVIA